MNKKQWFVMFQIWLWVWLVWGIFEVFILKSSSFFFLMLCFVVYILFTVVEGKKAFTDTQVDRDYPY